MVDPLEAKRALLGSGLCSKAPVEEQGECLLAYCQSDPPLLVAIAEYGEWVYAKAVPETVAPATWTCSDIYYNPYGQYAFARSPEELARKLLEKQGLLKAQARLAAHRLSTRTRD